MLVTMFYYADNNVHRLDWPAQCLNSIPLSTFGTNWTSEWGFGRCSQIPLYNWVRCCKSNGDSFLWLSCTNSGEEKRSLASWNVMTAYSNDNHVGAAWFLNPTLSLMRLHQDMPDCAGHNPDTKHLGGADLARSWPDDIPPGTQPPRCPMSIGPHTTERPTLTQTHSKVGAQSPALLLL